MKCLTKKLVKEEDDDDKDIDNAVHWLIDNANGLPMQKQHWSTWKSLESLKAQIMKEHAKMSVSTKWHTQITEC